MMNPRENLLSLLRRKGFDSAPVDFFLCPSLKKAFENRTGGRDYEAYYGMPWRRVTGIPPTDMNTDRFRKYYQDLKPGAQIDAYGVAHEPGSAAAVHMTYMRNPLRDIEEMDQLLAYPFPSYDGANNAAQRLEAEELKAQGLASVGNMQVTIWETAWYLRGMENLMMDMMSDDPLAEKLLDIVTELHIKLGRLYVEAGVDILFLGDDIGMQRTLLMSEDLYVEWIKPRLKRLIAEMRRINPDVMIFYHSCGYVKPLIGHLIEAGIDVLNPVQPECMDFAEVHALYKGAVSFHGTLGTQTLMPFGTPEDIRREVFRNLDIAGKSGGLFVAPTHMLEPEVPFENIEAYVEACRAYA